VPSATIEGVSEDSVDFAVVAYREEGAWQVQPLPHRVAAGDLDALVVALRPWPSESGSLGLVSIDEDFFVLVRVQGRDVRVLLSDVTAAAEWPLAAAVMDLLDLPEPDDEDDPQPAGQMDIVADLGVTAIDLALLCDDPDLYPDEVLTDVAHRLGFGPEFEGALEGASV
jgi:putative tRNA adenosine deaminase-associated protein